MKNFIKCLRIIALAAVIVFTMTACGGGGGGGRVRGPLVGHWFSTQEEADKVSGSKAQSGVPDVAKGTMMESLLSLLEVHFTVGDHFILPTYSFMPDGRLFVGGFSIDSTYTATANTITINIGGGIGTADYTISGNALTIKMRAEQQGGLVSGTYYKAR